MEGVGAIGDPGDLAEARDVGEHLVQVGRIQRDHLRMGGKPGRDGHDVVVGDGADLADGLGHDQVDLQLSQSRFIELVEVAALAGQPPDLGVDLAGREPLGDKAPGQMALAGGLWRVVTLVGDGHDLIAQAEGE